MKKISAKACSGINKIDDGDDDNEFGGILCPGHMRFTQAVLGGKKWPCTICSRMRVRFRINSTVYTYVRVKYAEKLFGTTDRICGYTVY